jgi:PAS domain S-box-containing protein
MGPKKTNPEILPEAMMEVLTELSVGTSIASLDTEFRYTYFNEPHKIRMKELFGIDIRVGMNFLECLEGTGYLPVVQTGIKDAMGGKPYNAVHNEPVPSRYIEYNIRPIRQAGKIVGVAMQAKDVTQQKVRENEFRETDLKLRKIYSEGPIGMVIVDEGMHFLSANPAFCKFLGYEEKELVGLTVKDVTHPEDMQVDMPNIQRLIRKEQPTYSTEKRYVRKEGQLVWGSLTVTPNFNEKGEFEFLLAIIENIHERKMSEQALSTMADRLDLAARAAKIGIWDYDIPSDCVSWDARMFELHGYPGQEFSLTYDQWLSHLHPDDRKQMDLLSQEVLRGEKEYDTEIRIIWPDGSIHWLKANGQVFYDKDGNPVRMVGVNYDITETKKTLTRLLESEDRFSKAFHGSPVGQLITQYPQGTIVDVNEAYCRIVGYTRDELINRIPLVVGMWADPEDRNELFRRVEEEGHVKDAEFNFLTKSGNILTLMISVEMIQISGIPCLITIGNDITERKKTEQLIHDLNMKLEQRVQERTYQLENANKDLESFSYTVSHDLRAPLRHINGFISLLNDRYAESIPDQGRHYLDSITDAANHMGVLIDDLLQFSRTGRREMQKSTLDMNQLVNEVIESMKTETSGRKITWEVEKLPAVQGDITLIRQVWANLLSNAIKFTKIRGKAEIRIGSRSEKHETVFYVKDNGAGFDMRYYGKLFGVFQRLHSMKEFEGTGIGLANVKKIVSKHGGRTWAESVLNEGAVFYFSLPASKS